MQSGMHGAAMATPLRASSASVGVMGESERRRVLLLRLLGEIAAFIKQKQRRQDASTAPLFHTVLRVCEARLERLEDGDDGLSLSSSSAMTPRVAVAEAMVQELLVSLVSIRKSETESLVMEEVENVESMRTLLTQLRQDEKSLRRVVTNGAGGGDSQLRELQLLLRDELVQELALVRAQGLADSLHADASMQFAWETIHGQKMEIVRLRAENEDLQRRDIASGGAFRVSVMSNIEPKHAIQVLRSEIARHHESNIHALQKHLEQLEDALRRTTKTSSNRTKKTKALRSRSYNQSGISETTLDSSREQDRNNDSILLPSHLTNEVDLSVCEQCQQSGKTILGLQSELRQLRAQVAADEDSLVRAQQEHLLMKKEHSALTSALISAKQKQEELRQMIRDISEEKSRIQTLSETKQKTLEHDVEVLRREIASLELKNEQVVRDLALRRNEIVEFQKETGALRVECDGLRRTVHEQQNQLVLTDCALTSARATTSEVRYTTQTLHRKLEEKASELAEAQDKCRHIDAKLEEAFNQKAELQKQLGFAQHSTKELARALERSQRDRKDHDNNGVALSQQLQDAKQKLTRLKQENKQLKDEMRHSQNESAQEARELAAARESVRALQHHVAAVEGRLNRTEEEILSQSATAQAENEKCHELRTALDDQRMELQRTHEECQRLHVELKHAVDLKNQLQRDFASLKQDESRIKRDTNSLEQQRIELHKEIEDSKTTILMWMSKYNAVVEAKARLENDTREKLDQAQRDKEELQKARAHEAESLRKKDDLLKELSSAKKKSHMQHQVALDLYRRCTNLYQSGNH
ncbi:hypothetical protein Poli38472_000530 [Pythium oligandrum]|uniref:Uncharacterized protein n=1 Tax=Pythium oligandrum TaxID=41045 RepID=A0A8K1CD94_PYTOL|nr:hypothetical protein Poli38472_000530 [Pythium oligandrum]|eukprot:TMW60488.1 hypothetical protein Poli38472_000530 [Pythium oligandrum]